MHHDWTTRAFVARPPRQYFRFGMQVFIFRVMKAMRHCDLSDHRVSTLMHLGGSVLIYQPRAKQKLSSPLES
jgi:hypothetical protein